MINVSLEDYRDRRDLCAQAVAARRKSVSLLLGMCALGLAVAFTAPFLSLWLFAPSLSLLVASLIIMASASPDAAWLLADLHSAELAYRAALRRQESK